MQVVFIFSSTSPFNLVVFLPNGNQMTSQPVEHYRPISLLPHSTFRQPNSAWFSSCVTERPSALHTIGNYLDKNTRTTNVLYLHFAKAFDSVDHNRS